MHVDLKKCLRAPGSGLLTVTTGAGSAEKILSKVFKKAQFEAWPDEVEKRLSKRFPFYILGVPSDSGGGICRGAAHGPLALRAELYSSEKRYAQADLGDVPCIPQLVHDSMLNDAQLKRSREALWGSSQNSFPVSPLSVVEATLLELFERLPNFKPLVLGGDHSISGPIFSAFHKAGRLKNTAVLHFDAHTDLLESRYGVEHCFATWVAPSLKFLDNPALWVQLGIRTSRNTKEHWEKTYGLKQYWAQEIRKKDPKKFSQFLTTHFKTLGAEKIYITNDIDGTDSIFAPSTGTPEPKGLDPKWVETVIRELSGSFELTGADLMEVAPVLGSKAQAKKTVKLGARYLKALNWG